MRYRGYAVKAPNGKVTRFAWCKSDAIKYAEKINGIIGRYWANL